MLQEFLDSLHYHYSGFNISWLCETQEACNSSYILFIWRQKGLAFG